jgi:hypothetical protein
MMNFIIQRVHGPNLIGYLELLETGLSSQSSDYAYRFGNRGIVVPFAARTRNRSLLEGYQSMGPTKPPI